jgi:hypothetical protein
VKNLFLALILGRDVLTLHTNMHMQMSIHYWVSFRLGITIQSVRFAIPDKTKNI